MCQRIKIIKEMIFLQQTSYSYLFLLQTLLFFIEINLQTDQLIKDQFQIEITKTPSKKNYKLNYLFNITLTRDNSFDKQFHIMDEGRVNFQNLHHNKVYYFYLKSQSEFTQITEHFKIIILIKKQFFNYLLNPKETFKRKKYLKICQLQNSFTSAQSLIISYSMTENININHVVQALNAIHLQGATPEQIHIANSYLTKCEQLPQFPLTLLNIYSQTNDVQLQLSSILLFTNVAKRNWNRNQPNLRTGLDKEIIKKSIMNAYLLHNMKHFKHFNALFKALVRFSYPDKFRELHQFVLSSLQNMGDIAQKSPQQFISNSYTVPVFSHLKTIIKQYSNKKLSHCEADFIEYMVPVISRGAVLSQQMQNLLKEAFSSGNIQVIVVVLQMARKADKIMLYALSSMPSSYQNDQQIKNVIKSTVGKIKEYDQILKLSNLNQNIREEVQKYIIGILQLITKLQQTFPFLFTNFLKEYLQLLITMIVINISTGKYTKQKLISVILTANIKPINTYPYYTKPQDFRASIYCRKSSSGNNNQAQQLSYAIYTEIYSPVVIQKLLITIISEIMTLQIVWQTEKAQLDELILQDVQIAIVDQVGQPTAYEHSVSLCKVLIKNFKNQGLKVVNRMLDEINNLKSQGEVGNRIITNLVEIVFYLPQICNQTDLPIAKICTILEFLYSANRLKELSKLIRKYHSYFDSKLGRTCFELLVQIVSSPINEITTAEVIYQSALGLKCLLNESFDFDSNSTQALIPCMSNIIEIMKMKHFICNPTLLWPIINLIIKLISTSYQNNKVQILGINIVNGLHELLHKNNNLQILVSALNELLSCILYITFSNVKHEYPLNINVVNAEELLQQLNPQSSVIYEGALALVEMNINNPALQNFDVVYRLWLTLLRHYPTIIQQNRIGIDFSSLNTRLTNLFQLRHEQLADDSTVYFLQILEEMYLLGLTPLDQQKLTQIIMNSLEQLQQEAKKIRTVLGTATLYLSYALTRSHVPRLLGVFVQQMIFYKSKISPPINTLRCFLYLIFDLYILSRNALQAYQELTNNSGIEFRDWFQTFCYTMQYVSSKQLAKVNAATILKAISDIGYANYAQMLLTQSKQGQFPMDSVLRTITMKIDAIPQPSLYNLDIFYKTVIPNDYVPEFAVVKLRKLRLHFGNSLVREILSQDLRQILKERFGAIFVYLNWGNDDIGQRVGTGPSNVLSNLLGWTHQQQTSF